MTSWNLCFFFCETVIKTPVLQGCEDEMERPRAAILVLKSGGRGYLGVRAGSWPHPVTRTHVATGTGIQRIPGEREAQ